MGKAPVSSLKDSARENFERRYGKITSKVISDETRGYGEGKKLFTDEGLLDEIQECVASNGDSEDEDEEGAIDENGHKLHKAKRDLFNPLGTD